ncbi:MAG: hypothetical protein IJR66_01010 [Clostridia bacterium]|nr:hypothetical protein [Clostridia bacterium]
MIESFYEESSHVINEKGERNKYLTFKVFSIIFIVLSVIYLILVLSNVEIGNLIPFIFPLIFLVSWAVFFGIFKNRFYVDYDYTIVTGSVRFSKIIMNTKRKSIAIFDCSDIEKIGKYNSDTFNNYKKMPELKLNILTKNSNASENKDFYYIVCKVNGEKKFYLLECSKTFLVNLIKYAGKGVLERDFV